jgi:unsaturated rhamnogalacturonyl hydrolase
MKKLFLFLLILSSTLGIAAQTQPDSERLAEIAMKRLWLDERNQPGIPPKWTYEQGVVHKGIEAMWYATGDAKYFDHIKKGMDHWIDEKGNHKNYDIEEYNIDHITPGTSMLTLWRATGDLKYHKMVELFRSQLKTHPRTKEGGFWHKKIYPYQMWLDGLYMGQPFYAEYSAVFGEENWNDIANQFVWMEKNSRDAKTGLLYHGWDESKQQRWADKTTGRSPHFWGRAMGWYAMGIVDTLEHFPKDHPRRGELIAILNRLVVAVEKVQDKKRGVWWDILDFPSREKNYLESSASAMFVYAIARGVREGYLPEKHMKIATTGWAGIQREFIKTNDKGETTWEGTVSVSGLGGNPYRDGSYEYYMSEKLRTNDAKGLGPAIRAAVEIEAYKAGWAGKGKMVLLDDHFNREIRKGKLGKDEVWHYKFDEKLDSGYSIWGDVFRSMGAKIGHLSAAPAAANLAGADVYIIVDPDTPRETANPNFIGPNDIKAIADWVKKGGVLVMFGNDAVNAELDRFNELGREFGVQFDKNQKFPVINNNYPMGKAMINAGNPVFPNTKAIFLKEVSSLTLSKDAKAVLTANGDNIMAAAKHGKGTVFVLGDPWLYNEYTDGRRLTAEYQNLQAAKDLSRWLLNAAKR